MTQDALKLYILPVRHGTQQRRLFFEGPDTEEASRRFSEAVRDLESIGDAASSFDGFVTDTIVRFERVGFRQVAH